MDTYYLKVFVGQVPWHGLTGFSAQSHKAEIKVLVGLHSHLEPGVFFQAHSDYITV